MLCFAHTAFVVMPPAASRKIPTTCSSLYRLLFMFCPFLEDQNYTFNPSHFPGSGHSHRTNRQRFNHFVQGAIGWKSDGIQKAFLLQILIEVGIGKGGIASKV